MSDQRFIKLDTAKPCVMCQRRTFHVLQSSATRMHRECYRPSGAKP